MARRIVLLTHNQPKLAEYERRFSLYGVKVERGDKPPRDELPACEERLLADDTVLAVMCEASNLYDRTGALLKQPQHLDVCVNRTTLDVARRAKGGGVTHQRYEHHIEGHIDMRRRREPAREQDGHDVFGWDDIFVPKGVLRSYHELRQRGLKLSARDLVIADYVSEHLRYRQLIQLKWTPVEQRRSVDFAVDPVAFIAEHPVYRRLPSDHLLQKVLGQVLSQGLFFRAAKSRREKNYWLPGLNAGVPMTPKRDGIHEATFMFHDLMHFAFVDLLFDGEASEEHANSYIVHRMMSEAFTLVLADMVFVDALRQAGVEYDFARRRIHPLFASIQRAEDPTSLEQLRRVLYANARFCLAGDDAAYRELGACPEALDAFRSKYEQFFVSDYRWTAQNFRSMGHQMGPRAARWLELTAPLRAQLGSMPSVGEYAAALARRGVDRLDRDALIDAVFDDYFAHLSKLVARERVEDDLRRSCLKRGFLRYMAGQMALFVNYDLLPASAHYAQHLRDALANEPPDDLAGVQRLRAFYEQYVDILGQRALISADDRATFKELYPMFAPFYVAYDVDVTTPLAEISQRFGHDA